MDTITNSTPILTPLASRLRLSPTLEINELVQEELKKGRKVVHLGFGEATFPLQPNVASAHKQATLSTSYLPVAGLLKLRESIARFQTRRLGFVIDPEQVVVAPGSKPLLFALFDIMEGDVLLPRPSWVSYEPQILHAGKRLFWVETSEENRHAITESSLRLAYEKALESGGNPRIMLVNSPSNPTGQVYTTEVIDVLTTFCKERNITLISDEIYSDIDFAGDVNVSACAGNRLNTQRMVLTSGLSKTYSAGGWRVGYAIFPATAFGRSVRSTILAYASECWSAASAPAQEAAAVAFDTTPEMDLYRTQVRSLHKKCTLALYQALKECGLDVAEPKGAFYLYPSFQPYAKQLKDLGVETSSELSRWLIKECGIAALPGSAFGEDDNGLAGGRYRLRMATSYLYFNSQAERNEQGHDLLSSALTDENTVDLPLLDEAIKAVRDAVARLRT
ncbi:aminotransferase [Dothidotthia symphoricarpi CBS 119687]|uniref:Aminotransferase n=1 Tax=Dothidotthia symphoricarpi CBS 119687 TaxID=1392245 RepID=A0A6A6AQS5_9PLEO|nr:aminotransferase [Dothidotthia symphoricarpi CBS 119687]KAF2132861.1 aminotransferase [Dothidotthia symphoricarpi CBS 119687]